ncbi:hypothetical protein KC131_25940 [Pseudomonas sp. JQ170]|uniref:hypothetical protein n=1 Tax=unclassified Pseudomonas TaxID=196821 RepID=UPI0026547EB5|nr:MULTISPECIES: hypothetical protein [unclassified Pseudomonas]MDN7144091.1 hypothetical protein [Pseudomonas sp. JQ170]WRO74190.1 hypothetical protein U9R80_16865 [Pseudomonas sp. 170C]
MKIRALGPLSGAVGERTKGEEFEVSAEDGKGLIVRGYAEEVLEKATKPAKSDQAKE